MKKQLFFVITLVTMAQTICMDPALSKLAQSIKRYPNSSRLIEVLQDSKEIYSTETLNAIQQALRDVTKNGIVDAEAPFLPDELQQNGIRVIFDREGNPRSPYAYFIECFPPASRIPIMEMLPSGNIRETYALILRSRMQPGCVTSAKTEQLRRMILYYDNKRMTPTEIVTFSTKVADYNTDAKLLTFLKPLITQQNFPRAKQFIDSTNNIELTATQILEGILTDNITSLVQLIATTL